MSSGSSSFLAADERGFFVCKKIEFDTDFGDIAIFDLKSQAQWRYVTIEEKNTSCFLRCLP